MTWGAFVRMLVTLLGLRGTLDQVEPPHEGMTRRAFLQALGVTAAALAALPVELSLDSPLVLDEPMHASVNLSTWDAILKDIYAPAIIEQMAGESIAMRALSKTWVRRSSVRRPANGCSRCVVGTSLPVHR